MKKPYVGVTGFMSPGEVRAAIETFCHQPGMAGRLLMVGVLASSKSLAGIPTKWPERYPDPGKIASIFTHHGRALNLIHYSTDDRAMLAAQLRRLAEIGGDHLDGFQLNIAWPDPTALNWLAGRRVVLQLGSKALNEAGDDPARVAERLDAYRDVATDVLVDASGGRGVTLDVDAADAYVRAIRARHPRLGIGAAGGLCADTIGAIRPLVETHATISFDAEGRLQKASGGLDLHATNRYIVASNEILN